MSKKKYSGSVNGKGYYIALALCATAIGIAGLLYYRNTENSNVSMEDPAATIAGSNHQAVVATGPNGEPITQPATTPKVTIKTVSPLEGQTVAVYAMDSLTYNQTTRDWRVHNGMDIAAPAGTQVVAAADGVVYTTYTDDSYGTTVVIRHEDGYTTQYASLAEDLLVKAGESVTMGQAIGCVGSTALLENALGDHVHFSVTCQDIQMDPAEFLSLESN
jgi:murein DD-endopeptidase MepM/ murein hydrolase activator NlpD